MKTQLAMVIDSSVCINCQGCTIACKVENRVPEGHWRNWVKQEHPSVEALFENPKKAAIHFQPGGCMHCENPTCVQACPTGATYKEKADGTVMVDKKLCIGCGSCIPACPYGARYRHPVEKKVDKCDFCATRRARGELPACVITCPTKARTFGDINDPESDAALLLKKHKSVRVINVATDTRPHMYYLGSTAPMNWPQPAKAPTPIGWLKSVYPVVWALVGLNGLGVLAMLGKQLITRNEDDLPANDTAKKKGKKMIKRHTRTAIFMHWFNAACWLFLLATGMGLILNDSLALFGGAWSRWLRTLFGSAGALLTVHMTAGSIWVCGFLIYGLIGFRSAVTPFVREILALSPARDVLWLVKKGVQMTLGTGVLKKMGMDPQLPDQGFYNVGQKLFAVPSLFGGILIGISGIVLALSSVWFTNTLWVQWAILIHFVCVGLVFAGLLIHVYMAAIAPGERPAFISMFTGNVPEAHAEHHHRLWYLDINNRERE